MTLQVRPLNKTDKKWAVDLLKKWWSGPIIVTRGKIHHVDEYPGFIAIQKGRRAGLITYRISDKECEITSMNSLVERIGTGSALLDAVKKVAVSEGCNRLWLITTNDNTAALRFYKRYGFSLKAVYANVMEEYRKLKREIPLIGNDRIPIRDEIELEMVL